ncbi:11409_t:CDS:2 [Dentiscutata heterogama]|uniref:11409_t:CDS:1 n=1 Tax=Dentiscutata heterogama TaxID=1316150 RepID=A0ACA9KHU4_9GLOM|nr:11409_t:CDS:2 [Dentiscutata heterogama]
MNYQDDKNELAILKEFQFADENITTLSTEPIISFKNKFTSKLLNFKNLSEPINSLSAELPKIHEWDFPNFDDYNNDPSHVYFNYLIGQYMRMLTNK